MPAENIFIAAVNFNFETKTFKIQPAQTEAETNGAETQKSRSELESLRNSFIVIRDFNK